MATQISLQAEIHQLVRADLSACGELLQFLETEREALTERNLAELVEIIEAKARTLDKIDTQADTRYLLLSRLHRPTNEQAWQQLVEDVGGTQLMQDWQALRELLAECKRFNEINGRMISRGKQTLGKLLTLLRGQDLSTDLYNAHGESSGQYSSHTVVKV